MSDGELKYKISADGNGAKKELADVAAGVKASNAAAGTGTGVWAAYTGAMKAATSAVRGFFSALGVIGAVLGGINMVVSLWRQLNDLVGRGAAQAAETAAAKARELEAAEKAAAEAAKERFDAAKSAADEYVRKLREAMELEARAAAARAQVRSLAADKENAEIDAMQARGDISAPAAALEKEMVSLRAQKDNIKEQIDVLLDKLHVAEENVGRAEEAKTSAKFNLESAEERYDELWTAARQSMRRRKGTGFIAAGEQAQREKEAWLASAYAYSDVEAAQEKAQAAALERDAADKFYESIYDEVTPALKVLHAQLDVVNSKIETNGEKFAALGREDGSDALEAARRAREKADIDAEVSRGEKSQTVGELEKRRIDLEKQLADKQAEVDKRVKLFEGSSWDFDADKVLAALREGVAEAQTRLATNAEELEKARTGAVRPAKVEAPMVTAGSDPWRRVGAFVGNGQSSDRQVQIAMRSMTLLERGNVQLGMILRQLERMEATT